MTPQPQDQPDSGAALILTLFATTLAMILGTTILTVTVNDLRSARLARDSAAALALAEAGISQLATYVRTYGTGPLACGPSGCQGYAGSSAKETVEIDGRGSYTFWVTSNAPLPTENPGVYQFHAIGRSGEGQREIVVEATIGTQPIGLPLGIFADRVNGGGDSTVTRESIFTTGCVFSRKQIDMRGDDVALGIPAAVHSSQSISVQASGTGNCEDPRGEIHGPGSPCNANYPWDHSNSGGDLTGKVSCGPAAARADFYGQLDIDGAPGLDVEGSYIKDDETLRRLFGIPRKPFTDAQLDTLRAVAASQGQHYENTTSYISPEPASFPHSVMFFELDGAFSGRRLISLDELVGWDRAVDLSPDDPACTDTSLLIVVEGANVELSSNTGRGSTQAAEPTQGMAASIVLTSSAPLGAVTRAAGGASLIGTIYADSVDLSGTVDASLDTCFVHRLSPSLVDTTLSLSEYREVDRTD